MAHAQNLAAKAQAHAQEAHNAQAQAQVKALHAQTLQVCEDDVPSVCAFRMHDICVLTPS